MRVIDGSSNQLYYLFMDHLGSTSEVRNADGSLHSRRYYTAFGAVRYSYGALPTGRTYTGQTEIEFDLMHYGARIYDPGLAHFLQADSIDPDRYDPGSWNKYSYVQYNPINAIDPTGHREVECDSEGNCLNIPSLLAQYHHAGYWHRADLTFDEFIIGYGCYQYFMAHPEEALQNAMDDTDAYYYADTYSEYVLHAMFQPFDEGPVIVMAEKVRKEGDAKTFYGTMLWLFTGLFFEPDKGFGGGSGGWRFGVFKSPEKWASQMAKRGWTIQQINEAYIMGEKFPATNLVYPGHTATRYVHPITGRSIVIDDITGELLHIGATVMGTDIEVIYVRLLNEGTYVYRPVGAIKLDDFTFRILPTADYDPFDEEWEFPPGKIVRCRKELVNNYISLVAFEEVIR